jgi:ubiquinone/menaquinone biosynthesis C-methylase UbiE
VEEYIMKKNIKEWEKIYQWNKEEKNYLIYPDEEVVRIIKKFFVPNNIKNVLDAGCGAGRHSLAMLRENINVTAIDTSESAVNISKELILGTYKNINISVASITELPFENDSFEGIICWGVLHYLTNDEFDKAMNELYRVLKPGGFIGLTLRSIEDSECDDNNKDIMQSSNAYESKNILFKYFDEDDIKKIMSRFKMFKYGHKTKTIFEDNKRKMAHWFIVAEK